MKINLDKLGFRIFRHSLVLPATNENTKTKSNLVNIVIVQLIITQLFVLDGQRIKIFWKL